MYQRVIQFFSQYGMRYLSSYFLPLKEVLRKANINILFETYVGMMVAASVISFFILALGLSYITWSVMQVTLPFAILSGIFVGVTFAFVVLTLFHSYPFNASERKKGNIEANLPFAANHMAAIAASGVPPFVLFSLVSHIHEYGEVASESARIVRNVELFGMDVVSAIKNVANRTPSPDLSQFLYGLISVIDTGGDIKKYLANTSQTYIFNYRLKRENYLKLLSTYADLYTAILIAAPLFFVSVLSIMSLLGGTFAGMAIPDALNIGIYVFIPLLNIFFIAFLNITQPQV